MELNSSSCHSTVASGRPGHIPLKKVATSGMPSAVISVQLVQVKTALSVCLRGLGSAEQLPLHLFMPIPKAVFKQQFAHSRNRFGIILSLSFALMSARLYSAPRSVQKLPKQGSKAGGLLIGVVCTVPILTAKEFPICMRRPRLAVFESQRHCVLRSACVPARPADLCRSQSQGTKVHTAGNRFVTSMSASH